MVDESVPAAIIPGKDFAPGDISLQEEGAVMEGMDSEVANHPDLHQLQRFAQGLLPPREAAALEKHLSHCESCCRLLETAPGDSFLLRLREAKALSSSQTQTYPVRSAFQLDEAIPDDLADHPRYRVFRLLGCGGMGAVYLAEHRRMDRLVALKVIHPEFLRQSGTSTRFQQEVRAAARLDHPNIVAAYDADQAGELHFLVMEYVEGQNVADYLGAHGPLPVEQACNIVRQAALGLQHAHECGMVHRDIKPHNLMLTPDGQVKVLDFGLARLACETANASPCDARSGTANLTGAGAVIGTADYIAPEQARAAHLVDGRSDIYSLGCALYHLLTGRPPFPEGSACEKLVLHETESPVWLCDVRHDIPEELARIVAKMMAKNPEERHQSAAEVAAALRTFTPRQDPPDGPRRRRLTIAALLFAALCCAAGLGWWLRAPGGADERMAARADLASTEGRSTDQPGEVRRWKGHGHCSVYRIVVAPDGCSAWSVADDFRRWDVGTGTTVQLAVTPQRLEELLPTPDGKQFLTLGAPGGAIRFFDTATMEPVRSFPYHLAKSWQAAWFPDGRRFVTDCSDGFVRIWDVESRVPVLEFGGRGGVSCVAVSQDGGRFLSGHEIDGKIRVWDPRGDKPSFEIPEQVCHPGSAHFVLGGKAILSGGRDGSVRLFDVGTGKVLRVFGTAKLATSWARIAVFQDGRHFVSADPHESLRLWRVDRERELYSARTDVGGAACLTVTPDGRHALIGTHHGDIVQWRLPDVAAPDALESTADGNSLSAEPRPGRPAAVTATDLIDWPAPRKNGDEILLEGYTDAVWSVAFSPDGRYTLSTGRRNYLHDRSNYRVVRRLGAGVWFAAFSPDGRQALTGDLIMRGILLWDVESGKAVRWFNNPPVVGRVLNGCFSRDGKYVAATVWNTVRVHDKETGALVMTTETSSGCRPAIAFTPEGRLMVMAPDGRSIRTYDIHTGKAAAPPLLSPEPLWALAISPDGRFVLATRTEGAGALLWEVGKQHPVHRLVPSKEGKGGSDQHVAFLPDGRRALTTTTEGTMTLWDFSTQSKLRTWSGLGNVVSVAVSPDGRWAMCGLMAERRARLIRLTDTDRPDKITSR
jgi:WD40 repeat protein